MTEHTPTPWKVFTTPDGRKLVGIAREDGEGVLDAGFGVWAWKDAEGIANAELVVKAVNSHDALVKSLADALAAFEDIKRLCADSTDDMLHFIGKVAEAVLEDTPRPDGAVSSPGESL